MSKKLQLVELALPCFWEKGYAATSMSELTKISGISRQNIYTEFGNKHMLFLACLDHYRDTVVTPAFEKVEQKSALISDIENYFEAQIKMGEAEGLPGNGCLMVNTSTESAPQHEDIQEKVTQHYSRISLGFKKAIKNEASQAQNKTIDSNQISLLADLLTSFSRGLWALARSAESAKDLRLLAQTQIALLKVTVCGQTP